MEDAYRRSDYNPFQDEDSLIDGDKGFVDGVDYALGYIERMKSTGERRGEGDARSLVNDALLSWLRRRWIREVEQGFYGSYRSEVIGDAEHEPVSVRSWEDSLPSCDGCPTCGYGGEEYLIIRFTTVSGEDGEMRHVLREGFGGFMSDLCRM